MGNAPTKALQRKGKKNVHWSNADRPTPPGKPQLVPGTPLNQPDVVTIRWEAPAHDGGAPITGYLVEHRRTGSPHWVRATPALVPTPVLTLSGLEPGWRYQFRVSAENAAGVSDPGELSEPLTVTLQRSAAAAPHFTQELKETTVLENEKAEFCVHYRGTPTPQISWFKDGFEIFSSRRTKIVTENDQSTLVIFQAAFNDEGEIKCTATNRVGHVVSKAKLRLEAPPRIRLPRQYEDGLLFEMDEIIRLKVSVAGRPLPRVTWHHNGDPVVFGGRHEITNTERSSSLRVGEARREDRGEYQVRATSRLGEDAVSVLVTVTDRPLPPGKAKIGMTLGRSVTLSWTKPDDDGGCKIGNYLVEYYRLGWNVWLKAATCRQLTTTLGDLIEGSEYKFRVKAENPYGVSDPSNESEVVFIPDPKRGLLEAPARGSTQVEPPPDQVKEDRKRRPQPSPDPSKTKRERHSDSSMEYPSSDADSVDARLQGKKEAQGQMRRMPDTQRPKERERQQPLIPLTVLEHDNAKGESVAKRKITTTVDRKMPDEVSVTPESKRRRDKENGNKVGSSEVPSKPKQSSPLQAKKSEAKPAARSGVAGRGSKVSKSKEDDYRGLSPEVFSLKIPVGIRPKSEEKEALAPPPKPQELPREEDDSLLHGSSEMMLVLLPQTRDDQIQTDRDRGESFSRSLEEGYSLGVAPPMSLSAPELGSAEPLVLPTLRNAISSTELLHEKTMARFFLEAAAEEVAQSIARRRSVERRHSLETRPEPTSARNKLRLTSLEEKSPEKFEKHTSKKTPPQEELLWHQKKASPEQSRKSDSYQIMSKHLTEEEQEEADFARLRERIAKTLEEDFRTVENEMLYMKKSSTKRTDDDVDDEEEEEEEDEEVGDEEIDEEEVEEEENLEEEEDEEESTEESEEESEDDIEEEDEPYIPRDNGMSKTMAPLRSMEHNTFSDDDEEEPYHPRSMAPRTMMVKEVPPPIPIHREILTVRTLNDTSISTPPVRFEPKTDLQPKPILKMSSKFESENVKNNSKSQLPRASTPFGADEKKIGKKPILNKILGKIESPFKRSKTPPVDPASSDVVVRRRKKDPQPESRSKQPAQEAESREGDLGLSAAEIARKRRLQTRQESLEEDSEANQILISHYSEIVKEYGSSRKNSPTLFLNTEQLKAAAEGYIAESDISISPEPVHEKFRQFKTRPQTDINPDVKKIAVAKPTPIRQKPQPKHLPQTPSPTTQTPSPLQTPSPIPETPSPPMIQDKPYQQDSSEEENSEDKPLGNWEFTPRHVMARIRRSLTPKHSFRRQRRSRVIVNEEEVIKMAETRVHHFIGYLTDLAMFMVACWLYLFKDERLAIPVLLLMVYRQMHEAIMRWVPERWKRK